MEYISLKTKKSWMQLKKKWTKALIPSRQLQTVVLYIENMKLTLEAKLTRKLTRYAIRTQTFPSILRHLLVLRLMLRNE